MEDITQPLPPTTPEQVSPVISSGKPSDKEEDPNLKRKKQLSSFRHAVDLTKQHKRRYLIKEWEDSVNYRRGKPYKTSSDQDRIAVPLDWSLTKEKEAQLFSQVPAVRLSHPPYTLAPENIGWVHQFEQKLNDTAITAGIESAMNEVLPDCINAAGIGVVIVSREAITDTVMLPAIDLSTFPPELAEIIKQTKQLPDGSPLPMEPTPRVLDARYTVLRISPADFLWPLGFTGSDFDMAPWIGRTGRISWPEAVQRFGLEESEKKSVVGETRTSEDHIDQISRDMTLPDTNLYDETVEFDEIFYKVFQFEEAASNFTEIQHLVFIKGKTKPVIDEPWKGQLVDSESNLVLGSQKYPIRVLTLAYITDEAIPPSDSAMGRTQVDELNKSRSQIMKQRERSIPVNWFDVNRIDPSVQFNLMRGVWQGYIPVQGQGNNVIGQVQHNGMSPETFAFDKIAKSDLTETWQIGAGLFSTNSETKYETQALVGGMQQRVARERAKVGKFFIGIMEVLGGLLSIFEDPSTFAQGFTPKISKALSYSILADSTVLLDSNQRLKKLTDFVNFFAKSGWVDIESVVKEGATLSGLDPSVVVRPPQPKPPSEPNLSYRLTGTEDMMNPLNLAFMMKSGQAPDVDLIDKAKQLLMATVMPPEWNDYVALMMQKNNGPVGPDGGMPSPPSSRQTLLPLDQPLPQVGVPQPPVPEVGAAHPNWSAMDRLNKRVVERE